MDDADRAGPLIDLELDTLLAGREPLESRASPGGHCVDCGDPIDPARLAALPGALRCIDCRRDDELRRAQRARQGVLA
jgi:RNA polymerase-binding transcription factor DksA